jgi:hypothetical protein
MTKIQEKFFMRRSLKLKTRRLKKPTLEIQKWLKIKKIARIILNPKKILLYDEKKPNQNKKSRKKRGGCTFFVDCRFG